MVDGEGQQAAAIRPRPPGRDAQQGDGVAAARQGDGDRVIDVGLEPAVEDRPRPLRPFRRDRAQPGLRAGGRAAAGAAQAKRVRISVARVRRAAEAPSA